MYKPTFLSKSLIKLMITITGLAFAASGTMLAQPVTVSAGSGSASPGGMVTVPITIASGGAQSGGRPVDDGLFVLRHFERQRSRWIHCHRCTKSVICSSGSTATTCVTYGTNENVIGDGTVANVTFTISPGSLDTSSPIQVTGVMVTDITGSTQFQPLELAESLRSSSQLQPTLSGLSCTPATVNGGGTSACTASLSGAALTGGFGVALSSNNSIVTRTGECHRNLPARPAPRFQPR